MFILDAEEKMEIELWNANRWDGYQLMLLFTTRVSHTFTAVVVHLSGAKRSTLQTWKKVYDQCTFPHANTQFVLADTEMQCELPLLVCVEHSLVVVKALLS
jgi:hypothetical protein